MSQKEGVGRVSESSMSMPVDLKVDASLDYIYFVRDYGLMKIELEMGIVRKRIGMPVISVRVSPEVRSPEVGSVRLEDFSMDLDIEGDSPVLRATFYLTIRKRFIPSPIHSLLRKLVSKRETLVINKTVPVRIPPNIEKYSRIIYMLLRKRYVKVKVYYKMPGQAEAGLPRIRDLKVGQEFDGKIAAAFEKIMLKRVPYKIYLNPAYMRPLKEPKLLRRLPKETLEELAKYGLISLSETERRPTYFGRMCVLSAERKGYVFVKTLAELLEEEEMKKREQAREAPEPEEAEPKEEFKPERFYPCLEEVYAERLSEELIKNGILTPTQSYLAGRLQEYLSSPPERPFIVYGVRGVGKTFTVRYVLEDNYRYTYVDKGDWTVKTISKGEPMVEVFDDWHYLCEGVMRGFIELGEFRRFLEMLRDSIGVRHVVLVSDEIPSSYLYKLPEDFAGIVEELVGLTIGWKVSLENVNILELEPSSIADYLKHMEGPDKSKEFIEYLCRGRLRRLAKILKQFNGRIPAIEELTEWIGVSLDIDRSDAELLVAKLTKDEGKLREIFNRMFMESIKRLERLKIVKTEKGRKTRAKKLKKTEIEVEKEKVRLRMEAIYSNLVAIMESKLPKLFGEEGLEVVMWQVERGEVGL
jgi:hypothetical protein